MASDKVTPKDFEQLAGDAGLAKPLVRRRVPELATAAIEALDNMNIISKVSDEVAELIRKPCARAGKISHLVQRHPHQLRRTPRVVAPKRSLKMRLRQIRSVQEYRRPKSGNAFLKIRVSRRRPMRQTAWPASSVSDFKFAVGGGVHKTIALED